MLTGSETFQLSQNAIAQEVGGELIVLDMLTERYLSVDKVGCTIWGLLDQGRKIGTVIDEISDHYRVDRSRIALDVSAFVGQLEHLGLGALRAE